MKFKRVLLQETCLYPVNIQLSSVISEPSPHMVLLWHTTNGALYVGHGELWWAPGLRDAKLCHGSPASMQHHFKLAESRHAACQMKAVTRSTAYHAGCCVLNHHEKTEAITWWQDDDFRSFYSLRDLTGLYVLKMVMMVQSFRMVSVSSEPASAQSQWQSCQYLKRLSKMTHPSHKEHPSPAWVCHAWPKKHETYLIISPSKLGCVMLRYVAFEFGCG